MLNHKNTNYNSLPGSLEKGGAGDESTDEISKREARRLATIVGSFNIMILILFYLFVEYPEQVFALKQDVQYVFYLNVTIMMVVGFGYLMTFMRDYGLSAVGFTFLITTICIPWAVLSGRFFASVANNGSDGYPGVLDGHNETQAWGKVELNVNSLLQGNFAAATVLISFGALIGKITPSQTALLAILEVPFYSFNKEVLCIGQIGTLDMGGTIFIHLFGAYFGLAAAWVLGPPKGNSGDNAEPSKVSDVFSLLGTVMLWVYWPSFNGATAPIGQNQQLLTTVNTVMSLCASCLTTFVVSALINGRISTVDIQNATLAGGVAVGAASNLHITPFFALLIGTSAAIVSVVGFNKIQSKLEHGLNLHDSCGVHNLHGMPAIVGSVSNFIPLHITSLIPPQQDLTKTIYFFSFFVHAHNFRLL
jgi:ammonium transporter Rh